MKHDEKKGWEMVWAAIGLIVVSCLLMYVIFALEAMDMSGILYNVILIGLAIVEVAEVALVYMLARKYFGKNK